MFRAGEPERERGVDGWGRGLPTRLGETLAFLEIRTHPFFQRFITMYEFNMVGISALLVLSKSVSSKTTHLIMESSADRDSSGRRLSFLCPLREQPRSQAK